MSRSLSILHKHMLTSLSYSLTTASLAVQQEVLLAPVD